MVAISLLTIAKVLVHIGGLMMSIQAFIDSEKQ